jgi:hypothetical protein
MITPIRPKENNSILMNDNCSFCLKLKLKGNLITGLEARKIIRFEKMKIKANRYANEIITS